MADKQAKKQTEALVESMPAAEHDQVMNIDLMELAYRLLASWKLIVCLALVFAIGAGVYTEYRVTPMYQASSIIYVVSRRDSIVNMSDLSLGAALTQDYLAVFNMWELHEQVRATLDLPYGYGRLRSMFSVSNLSDTRMLKLTVTSADPEEAAMLANEYARISCEYIAETMSTDPPNIMSVALVPTNPVSPNKTRNITMGFLAGAALAVACVTLRMMLDDKFKTADEIRRYTGMATLAVLPPPPGGEKHDHESSGGKKSRKRRKAA